MEYTINYKPILRELQHEVASILSEHEYFTNRKIVVLSEDLLDIEFQIKNSLARQGLVIVVNTMQCTYIGHDGMVNAWLIENLEIDVVENPAIWRPYLKKHGFEDGTTTDILYMIAEILGGPLSGIFGRFNPKSLEVGEDNQLVVGKAKFLTTVRQNVEGVIEEPTKVELPFITKHELAELLAEVDYLKNLVEDFSTEEIKADIVDLKAADTELGARIDGLANVYLPKGAYALTSDLAPYALKTQIPVEISLLNNDVGYITEIYWDEVKQKPDVALASDIPTNISQLNNDSNYLTSVSWSQIQNKPVIPENIPTKTSDLINDSGFLTEVAWNDILNKPNLVDEEKLDEATRNRPTFLLMNTAIDEKIADIPKNDDAKKLWNDTKTKYINGEKEIFRVETIPAHYTEWEFSDGLQHDIGIVENPAQTTVAVTIVIMGDLERKYNHIFLSTAEAQEFIDNATEIEFSGTGIESIFARRQYVEEQQTVIKIAELATTSLLPTKTSELENDSNFLTSHQSLDDYATKQYVDEKANAEKEAREQAVELINQELLNKADSDSIPTKTSQLQNDSNFLTEHQSLDDYATKQYVDEHVPEEFPWNRISGKPELVYKDQFDQANLNLQNLIDEINVEIEGQVEVNKVYGQYKARYIDGDGLIFEKQVDESYLQTGTLAKTSDIPINISYFINDIGYLTAVNWYDIALKPTIPTKLSELENDEEFLKTVSWEQIENKPDIATDIQFEQFKTEMIDGLQNKLDLSAYDSTSILNYNSKIDASGNVYESTVVPGYYTDWQYSDGQQYDQPLIYENTAAQNFYIAIDQDTYMSVESFETREAAQYRLDTALEIEYVVDSTTNLTATRDYVPYSMTWTKIDEVALTSLLPDTGISEDECRNIVESYNYQTASQVDSAILSKGYLTEAQVDSLINGKGYLTSAQVDSAILSKGYQTAAQVQLIAASTLPTDYVETELIGTLEDDTEVHFMILTKAME